MSDLSDLRPRQRRGSTGRDVRGAWWCVASALPAAVVGFVGGEAVVAALGYDGAGLPPWWVGGVALTCGVLPLAIVTALARRLHGRARSGGDDRAAVPAYLLVVLTAGLLVIYAFSWLMRVLLE